MSIVVVGANHRTAPLELLEKMNVSSDALPKMLSGLSQGEHSSEVVVLSTCNRTEVYLRAERFHGAFGEVRDFFCDLTFLPPEEFADSLYTHYDEHAVTHLFEVAAGLDSAVPGEHEILGQVKNAWEVALEEQTAGRGLNLLFRHALQVGKRARTETGIGTHVTSVSQAAVNIAAERLGGLEGRTAVVVGAGAMGRGMADFLVDQGIAELVIANRSPERAAEIVARSSVSARAVPLAEAGAELSSADLVLGATGAPGVILSASVIRQATEHRSQPLLVIDVALPRDIDPEAAMIPGVDLLDMTAVAKITEAALDERKREATQVRRIVEEEADRFASISSAREVDPYIAALRGRIEGIRVGELDRFAKRLGTLESDQRESVEALTKAIVAKVMHDPTMKLKESAGSSQGDRLATSVAELFDL